MIDCETKARRIMLLTPTKPGEGSVGEIFLRELCLMVPRDSIVCYVYYSSSYGLDGSQDSPLGIPLKVRAMPPETMEPAGRYRRNRFTGGMDATTRKKLITTVAREVLAFAHEHNVDTIWSVLAGPTMVELSDLVLSEWTGRFVAQVWDPIEYVIKHFNPSDSFREEVFQKFAKVISRAERCGVAGDGMKAEYELRYRVPCLPMINGCMPEPSTSDKPPLAEGNSFVIGFSGSNYARDAIDALLQALNSCRWRIADHDIHLKFMGNTFDFRINAVGHSVNIEVRGFRPVQEVVDYLSMCDAGYLPYWFGDEYSLPVRLCFPNKIAQYLAAGIPTLYHGPRDSSPTRFLSKHPVGVGCHSLENDEIISALTKLIEQKANRSRWQDACRRAMKMEMDRDKFQEQLFKLLDLGPVSETDMNSPDLISTRR